MAASTALRVLVKRGVKGKIPWRAKTLGRASFWQRRKRPKKMGFQGKYYGARREAAWASLGQRFKKAARPSTWRGAYRSSRVVRPVVEAFGPLGALWGSAAGSYGGMRYLEKRHPKQHKKVIRTLNKAELPLLGVNVAAGLRGISNTFTGRRVAPYFAVQGAAAGLVASVGRQRVKAYQAKQNRIHREYRMTLKARQQRRNAAKSRRKG